MKKSLLVLPALMLLLGACNGGGGGSSQSSSSSSSSSSSEPPVVTRAVTLTDATLLGYAGETIGYADKSDVVVDGMTFGYVQIGAYGNGLQWRNKNDVASAIFNTSIGAGETIKSLEITYTAGKYTEYAPTDQLEVLSGTSSQAEVATGTGTVFPTEVGVMKYVIDLPAGTTHFKISKIIAADGKNFSVYLESIVVNVVVPA